MIEYTERDDVLDHLEEHFDRQVARIAQGLRDMADRVERYRGKPMSAHAVEHGFAFSHLGSLVVHEVTQGIGSLPLETMLGAACSADDAARVARAKAFE